MGQLSSGMILTLGVRGRGFESRTGKLQFLESNNNNCNNSGLLNQIAI